MNPHAQIWAAFQLVEMRKQADWLDALGIGAGVGTGALLGSRAMSALGEKLAPTQAQRAAAGDAMIAWLNATQKSPDEYRATPQGRKAELSLMRPSDAAYSVTGLTAGGLLGGGLAKQLLKLRKRKPDESEQEQDDASANPQN